MRITPLDVRKQEFRKSVRGFDCEEVRAFLETLSHEYEAVLVDNKHLREQFMDQDEKISEYKTMERTLRDTLMTAERVMQDTRKNASKEGKLIIQDAELKARNIMEECRLCTVGLRREIMNLRQEKDNYLARFEGLASAQLQFISGHKSDFEDVDNRLLELATSAVATETSSGHLASSVDEVVSAIEGTGEGDKWRNYKSVPNITAASVDLAAMGIPVPAVPTAELGQEELVSPWPQSKDATTDNEVLV